MSTPRYVIIAAGGYGKRMGIHMPKQFILLHGKPVLLHTLENFYRFDPTLRFVVALPPDAQDLWNELIAQRLGTMMITTVSGGDQRFYSVQNALAEINGGGIVVVHDAVRCFTSHALMQRCFHAAEQFGSAIPVIPVNDSIREVIGERSSTVDRSALRAVQTPQCYKIDLLKRAYEQPHSMLFTDDATVVEHMGINVHLVEGEKTNFKITTPEDLDWANAMVQMRTGS